MVMNELVNGMKQVAAYLDDAIVFDSDLVAHYQTSFSLFERIRKHTLKLSSSKARLCPIDANFLGRSIIPGCLHPTAENVSALTNMTIPTDVKQVHALMAGVNYYRSILPALRNRLRPIKAYLRKGVKFAFMQIDERRISRKDR